MATFINIPYRCPDCGEKKKFSSLQELRMHLQTEHAILDDRSQHRVTVPSISCSSHHLEGSLHSSLLELYHNDARQLEEIVKISKEEELNNKRRRTQCKGLTSKVNARDCLPRATFREYGHSSRATRHFYPKQLPSKEKSGFANLYNQLHYSSDDDLKYNGSLFADTEFSVKNNGFPGQVNEETLLHVASHSNNEMRSYTDLCFQQPQNRMTNDRHVINTLTALSHDVLLERASQQATANSLYTTQEVLSGVEQAAEERVVQQQHLIDALAQELKEKERKLSNVMHEMENLHRQQLARIEKVNSLNQKYDEEKTDQELKKRQVELDCINKQIIEAKQTVNADCETKFQKSENKCSEAIFDQSKSMNDNINPSSQTVTENTQHNKLPSSESHERDAELASIKMKSAKLEQDRQTLITEMHNLLETAAVENDKLRAQLDEQTQKLGKLKDDLKLSKQDQADLLDETNTLYHQADVSLSLLKAMLKEREQQLKNMFGSIEQAQSIQEKLEKEKNECIKSSLERETMYKSLLAANSSQVKSVKEILELSQEEKLKLREELHKMREKLAVKDKEERQLADRMTQLQVELAVKEKTYAGMKEKVRRREDKLLKARWEMERVTTYLKATAKKEIEARSSLETIISGLVSRAAKAEAEVQQAKSSQVPHFTKCSVPVVQEKVQPLNDIFDDDASLSTSRIASHVTSHLELPDKIHSQDKTLTSTWKEKHTLASGKHNAGQLKQQHHQIPKTETIFEKRPHSEVIRYPSSLQQETPRLLFENTAEIERMIHNVKFEHTKNTNQLYSQNFHKVEEDRARQIIPAQRELGVTDLPLDANGIMWGEQLATTYIQKDGYPTYNNSPLLTQGVEHLKSNDDTDVDEELTDYVQEEDWTHYKNSNKTENWLKSQRTTPNSINRTTMAALQRDPLPLDEKVVKLLYSLEHGANSSSHPVNKNVPTDNLHESKKSKKSQKNNALSKSNDYSIADSFELSPLHKARAVQKRVEQLTAVNSSLSSAHFSSRQSAGFEVNHLEQESDFSSTSYASLEHPPNLFSQKESKQYTEDLQCKVPKESAQCADISTAEVKKSSEAVLVKDKQKCNNSIFLTPIKAITDAPPPYNNNAVTDLSVAHATDISSVFTEDADIEKQQTNTHHRAITEDLKKSENHVLKEDKGIEEQLAKICDRDITEFLNVSEDHVLEDERDNEKRLIDICQGGSKEYDVLTSENHILEKDTPCHILPDQELTKYTDATIMPANDLRTRTMNHSETQVTSSEEDLCDDNSHRKSVDATTDTDLEKLSMPGHLQKGFVVRKTIPNRRHFTRKRSRQRALMRQFQSQESLSSEPDELDTTDKSSRQAVRRMRIALFRVFSYLNTRTLLIVSCVSKEWNRVSRHPALWKHVRLANSTISSSFLITLSNWCTQTQSLSLEGSRDARGQSKSEDTASTFVASRPGLHGRSIMADETPESYQQAIRGSIESGLEKLLSACHDTMTVLHISDCDNILTDKCLWLVSGYCRLLTSLTYRSSVDPVTPQLIWALGGGCPGITSLFVHPQQPCERKNAMNNKCLLLIGQLYPDIEELGLGGQEFDKAGLLSLIQLCQRLKSLHLDHCLPITTDLASALCTAGLKYLQSLKISGTFVEAKAVHKFKECCRQLKRIHVSVSIQDCVDDPTKKKGQETYKKMVKALEVLKTELGFGVIFTLEATPV